jgi:23S rRNA pseudouridine2604 synthase
MEKTEGVRINKYLADQGYASRREADELVKQGRVKINGRVAQLGDRVTGADKVAVNLPEKEYVTLAYHKPRGLATEAIKPPRADLFPIGRLDKDSEGLLIFTNDGRLTTKLLDPKNKVEKEYVVTVDKKLDGLDLKKMREGMKIEREKTKPAKTEKLDESSFKIILTEGKKHQIRRMCAGLGYQVLELKRLRIGSVRLGQLASGGWKRVDYRIS